MQLDYKANFYLVDKPAKYTSQDICSIVKKKYSLIGIKAEFEAEGSTHSDIFLLRSITNKVKTKLFVN